MGLHIRQPPFEASGESKPIYTFLDNGYVLKVRGYIVDTISQIGQPFHMKGNEQADSKIIQTLSTCQTWWEMYANTRGSKTSTQEFCSTVYGGEWVSYSEPLPPDQRFQSLFCLAKKLLPPEKGIRLLPAQTAGTEKDHRAMASAASLRMHGKLFAMSTEQKLSCLVPLDTLEGDCICIVLGCSFPLVLRPFEKRYWLVGEAYVHDIMKGETMNGSQAGKYKEEDFALE
jgi:hypothetical protein